MKRGIVFLSMTAALVGAFTLGRAGAQEGTGTKEAAAEMAAWMELAKTGPEHAALMKDVGNWECNQKCWMTGPTPTESKGKVVFTSVLGGRFVRQDFEGKNVMGMPMQGVGYTGFNNATKKYEATWMDTDGTAIMFMTGTEKEPGKTVEFTGSFFGPGGKEMKSRMVLKRASADQMVMEMYDESRGGMKCMELTYTRSK